MFSPEQLADIQQRLETHKAEVIEYQEQLGVEVNRHKRNVLEGSLKYSSGQVELLQRQLEDDAMAKKRAEDEQRQADQRAAELEAERLRREELAAARKAAEKEAAERQRQKEAEERERARKAEEQRIANLEREKERKEALRLEAQKKKAEEEAAAEAAARRFVLEADGKGQAQKFALRVNVDDDTAFDILVEVKPVVR